MDDDLTNATALLLKEAQELLASAQEEIVAERRRADDATEKAATLAEDLKKYRLVKVAGVDNQQIRNTITSLIEIGFIDKKARDLHEDLLRDGGANAACKIIQQLAKSAVFLLDSTKPAEPIQKSAAEDDRLTRIWRDARRSAAVS